MTATCPNCSTVFAHVGQNEDGSPAIETRRCARPGCEVYLCRAGCQEISFLCEACDKRFCHHEHKFDGPLCVSCAAESVDSQEPDCGCTQTDVDLFDPRGCEFHDSESRWNTLRRAITRVQEYDRYQPHDAA